MGILIFIPMLVIMYFFMIRPQQRKMREHQALISGVKAGDEVVLSSGIYGIVNEVEGDVIWLEVAQDLELKVRRAAIEALVGPPQVEAATADSATAAEDD